MVEDPEVEVCNLAGNGLPGAFLASGFLASFGLTIFADRFGAFAADAFLLLDADFLNNLLIATIPPEGAKIMAWLM